jgi:hypothetical protein
MADGKSGTKNKMSPLRSSSTSRKSQIQQLHDEIDKLALLVHEAKIQSDKIQAAADAFGDLMLIDTGNAGASEIDGQVGKFEPRLRPSNTARSRTRPGRSLRMPTELAARPGAVS